MKTGVTTLIIILVVLLGSFIYSLLGYRQPATCSLDTESYIFEAGTCKPSTGCTQGDFNTLEACYQANPDYWNQDTIHLMQHEIEGRYFCFGCGFLRGKEICIDPIPDMKEVPETFERHCDHEFEVYSESCTEDRECNTPMSFSIQSNCPFGAICHESECKVICPIYSLEEITCQEDSDCDCSVRGNLTLECLCVNTKCLSVEG